MRTRWSRVGGDDTSACRHRRDIEVASKLMRSLATSRRRLDNHSICFVAFGMKTAKLNLTLYQYRRLYRLGVQFSPFIIAIVESQSV